MDTALNALSVSASLQTQWQPPGAEYSSQQNIDGHSGSRNLKRVFPALCFDCAREVGLLVEQINTVGWEVQPGVDGFKRPVLTFESAKGTLPLRHQTQSRRCAALPSGQNPRQTSPVNRKRAERPDKVENEQRDETQKKLITPCSAPYSNAALHTSAPRAIPSRDAHPPERTASSRDSRVPPPPPPRRPLPRSHPTQGSVSVQNQA